MDQKNLVGTVITITVAIICVATVMVPIFDGITETEETLTNDGLWRMKEIEYGDVWTKGYGAAWDYGDDAITIESSSSNILLGDKWCIRANGQVRSDSTTNVSTNLGYATATASEEFVVVDKTDTSWTRNLDYPGYGASLDGDYVMTAYGGGCYLLGDSVIYGSGVSDVDEVSVFVHIEATVDDGATIAVSSISGTTISDVVISNAAVNYTEDPDHVDVYKVDSVTFNVSFSTTENDETVEHTGVVTFSSYVVPYQITAELSEHMTSAEIALIYVLPVLMICAVLMIAVGMAAIRRD